MVKTYRDGVRSLLFPAKMVDIDRRTIAAGTPGIVLMERAGAACVRAIRANWPRRAVVVLAGPGNNGGDGWVIARRLAAIGWPVRLHSDWKADRLTGDARLACAASGMRAAPLCDAAFDDLPIIVDALFGAGLCRPLEGEVAALVARVRTAGAPVLAVDLPSGLCGKTGEVLGISPQGDVTVTFGAPKPGHLLGEGRRLSGALHVADIGLALGAEDADAVWNSPALWGRGLPYPPTAAHKYARGGVCVLGGGRHQGGAARLSAQAAASAGAGAVTVMASASSADIYAAHLDAIMVKAAKDVDEIHQYAVSPRVAAVVAGPGLGTDERSAEKLDAVLRAGKPAVLDADALTLLAADRDFSSLPAHSVLTPHEGEFARLFPDLSGSALERALAAAQLCGRTVLLKGAATVIASPGKKPVINTHASPWLATAGAGDVLAGVISALLAQGLEPHLAAAAGAYIHGESALKGGPGLTADTLWRNIPSAIRAVGAQTDD